ncbi:lysophospholipid acyltransferase family protein [Gemmatimonas sp.]|uniref:lysophospholipid acyltransferase family protein n=1 Tax=Gemmatimonas sp. TaxID=1962908 RepID=UPI00286E1157|nr:lysophospholipid acyltransferase family protein [Gemmatimonas sp.]
MLYELLKPVIGVALHWYYRSILTEGIERVPKDGPVFLAVNHPNALVDALVVGYAVPRRVHFTAKATIFANPLATTFLQAVGVVPLRRASDESKAGASSASPADAERNAASFEAVADALAKQGAIVIFPEGKSHDLPQLAPLRTGLARMTLQAYQAHGVRGVRIIPIGLLFERKEAPRSRVLMQVGEPIHVDPLVDAGISVATLTQLVTARLAAVTLNFDSPSDAERLQRVGGTLSALLEPTPSVAEGTPSLGRVLELLRRLDRVHSTLRARDDAELHTRLDGFEARVRAFGTRLDERGIDPHDLAISAQAAAGMRFAVREATLALIAAPIGFWGRLTHFAPIQLARRLALRNVQALDEPAMRTLVVGLLLVLAAYIVQTAVVASLAGGWWALAFFLTLVPSASSDLRYGDRTRRARDRARAYFAFRRDPALQGALLAEADAIRQDAFALERLAAER